MKCVSIGLALIFTFGCVTPAVKQAWDQSKKVHGQHDDEQSQAAREMLKVGQPLIGQPDVPTEITPEALKQTTRELAEDVKAQDTLRGLGQTALKLASDHVPLVGSLAGVVTALSGLAGMFWRKSKKIAVAAKTSIGAGRDVKHDIEAMVKKVSALVKKKERPTLAQVATMAGELGAMVDKFKALGEPSVAGYKELKRLFEEIKAVTKGVV